MAHVGSHRSTRTRTRRSATSRHGTDWAGVARIARRIRVWAWVFVVLTFLVGLAAFILSSTAFSQIDAYGTVPVPGTKVVHLPAGNVDISFATNSASNGSSFYTPGMSLQVTPAFGSGADPAVTDSSSSASTIGSQTSARVWKMQVPSAGDYRITAQGDTSAYINPELLLGHSPPGGMIVELGLITLGGLVLIIIVCGRVASRADKRAGPTLSPLTPPPIAPVVNFVASGVTAGGGLPPAGQAAQLEELSKLADLHDRGALTDAEFAAEKAKILGE
jgi:Short C-terminal domain